MKSWPAGRDGSEPARRSRVRLNRPDGAASEEDRHAHVHRGLDGERFAGRRLIGFLEHEASPAQGIQVGAESAVMIAHPAYTSRIRGSPEALRQVVTHQPAGPTVGVRDSLRLWSEKARMADHEDKRPAIREHPRH